MGKERKIETSSRLPSGRREKSKLFSKSEKEEENFKENFEYTTGMGFRNWDVGILGFGRDRT